MSNLYHNIVIVVERFIITKLLSMQIRMINLWYEIWQINYKLFLALITVTVKAEKWKESKRRNTRYKYDAALHPRTCLQIALCMTVHTLTTDNIFTEGLNWGISYDLPNESKPVLEPFLELRNDRLKASNKHDRYGSSTVADRNSAVKYSGWNNDIKSHFVPNRKKYRKSEYYYLQRRHRRELYNKLEVIMNAWALQ